MKPCRTHTRRAVRGTAAMLLTCSLLTAQAWAAKITPSATSVTLASNQKTFTVDVALSEETAFAGAEFGLDLPAGVTLTNVEFLDKAVQDANHSPEVTVEGRTFFGFYTAENTFSGDIKVARLTFSYTGDDAAAIRLGSSKVVTVQEDGSTKGDTTSEPFTVQITRKSGSSSGGGSSSTKPVLTVGAGGSAVLSSDYKTVTITPDTGYTVKDVTVNGVSKGAVSTVSVQSGDKVNITFQKAQAAAGVNSFTDLDGHWAKDVVLEAVDGGLFSGTGATTFSPDAAVTRGMLVTVLHRMEGTPAGGSQPFADVAAGAYYADAVAWAAGKGIVAGTSATAFAPDASVTREQMAAILYRYAQYKGAEVTARADLSAFADAGSISAYAVESIAWATGKGLISGRSATELAPQGTATRAEAASILVRFQKNVK